MEKIYIFCDSAGDIPREEVERYGIDIVPEHITHAGHSFREYYDMTPQQYWDLLESSDEIPTTAQVTPALAMECYERARAAGCTHVVGVMINAAGSGGYQSCGIARAMFYEKYGEDMRIELIDSESYTYIYGRVVVDMCRMRDAGDAFDDIARAMFYEKYGEDMRIELIDSESYTYIYGRVVVDMCRMRDAGDAFDDIVRIARSRKYGEDMRIELIDSESYTYIYGRVVVDMCRMRDAGDAFDDIVRIARSRLARSEAILGVYTLKHLKKSGRISGGAAFMGEALGLKPVSLVCAGKVDVIDKARGEKNLIPKVLSHVAKRVAQPEKQTASQGTVPCGKARRPA